jgi:hypothetical protein
MVALVLAGSAFAQALGNDIAPDGDGPFDQLSDVARLGRNDVWVVGNTAYDDDTSDPLAAHWNGTGWDVSSTPGGTLSRTFLTGVAALSDSEIYAVGYTSEESFTDPESRTFVLRYDGSSWSRVRSPNTMRDDNRLYDVAFASPSDGWAVGESVQTSNGHSLVMRWNGTRWRIVPSAPSPGSYPRLLGVEAIDTDDVWAVGSKFARGNDRGFAIHWDGAAWSEATVPDDEPYQTTLVDVDAISPDDVWAVGYHLTVIGFTEPYQTTAMHWDGSTWEVIDTPNPSEGNCILDAVAAFAPDDVWAVGWWDDSTMNHAMALHWDGVEWTQVGSDDPYDYFNELYGIGGTAGDVWAVGAGTDGIYSVESLVERGP